MSTSTAVPAPTADPKLRMWPAVVIVILQWVVIALPGKLFPDNPMLKFMGMMWGPVAGALLLIIWWLLFSRAWAIDRWLILAACIAIGGASYAVYDKSLGVFGLVMSALPVVVTAWVAWLLLTPWLRWPARCAGLIAVFIAAWGYFATVRFDGVDGDFNSSVSYRWQPTDEQRFLAQHSSSKGLKEASAAAATPIALAAGDWPGFRGANRDSRLAGVRINTDWSKSPPKELWRRRVGPGWSSFAVVGNRLYTQEQRDKDEVIVCYNADDGNEIWTHADTARFEEPVAGAGPRATPTFHEGRIYTLGAAGNLDCLDAATGKVLWTRDVLKDTEREKNQDWGLASSPLVHQGIVTVYAGNKDDNAVVGYKASNGEIAWKAGQGTHCYGSTQLAKVNGVEQLLIATDKGLFAFEPATGKVLWFNDWDTGGQIARIVQPAIVGESDVLIGTAFEKGTRRVHVSYDGDKWSTESKWESLPFKPYYNDLVIQGNTAYGFNGGMLTALNLDDGAILWKERGYGNGQLLLLADQNLLVVLTEKGEVALVSADPKKRTEVARFQAIQGKTWNHPVIAHGKLFVRNGVEMACFQLNPEQQPETAGGK